MEFNLTPATKLIPALDYWAPEHGPGVGKTEPVHSNVHFISSSANLKQITGLNYDELATWEIISRAILPWKLGTDLKRRFVVLGAPSVALTKLNDRVLQLAHASLDIVTPQLKSIVEGDGAANLKAWKNQLTAAKHKLSLLIANDRPAMWLAFALATEPAALVVRLPDQETGGVFTPAEWPNSVLTLMYLIAQCYENTSLVRTSVGPIYFVAIDRLPGKVRALAVFDYYKELTVQGPNLGLFTEQLRQSAEYLSFLDHVSTFWQVAQSEAKERLNAYIDEFQTSLMAPVPKARPIDMSGDWLAKFG